MTAVAAIRLVARNQWRVFRAAEVRKALFAEIQPVHAYRLRGAALRRAERRRLPAVRPAWRRRGSAPPSGSDGTESSACCESFPRFVYLNASQFPDNGRGASAA